ncbi:MAG: OmpA family protein [Fimbriimonas ginsengisoli]|uniref:OmpA family protein n=1 Tax=Fimbriimonas ginsengisoli TaxID=1005039 RepID=A0A931PU82_FIMGI|nr:OmpA family protein [Fimbriimonas ginsengisoli]
MNEGTPVIIKRKKGHEGQAHHGGSWKVAYADFVTAMMAFFMVMWIMGLSDQTRAQIQGYFNDPIGFMKNMPRSKSIINLQGPPPKPSPTPSIQQPKIEEEKRLRELQKELDKQIEADPNLGSLMKQVEMTVTQEGLQIELVENTGAVFFESGSAVIRPLAQRLIAQIAPVLAKSGRKMVIEGHTDASPYPSTSYTNWDLSADRANALRRALEADGVGESQVMQVRGYAATKLKKPEDPLHFSNRRVTVLLPFRDVNEPVVDLPKGAFDTDRQGAFRDPVQIAPNAPIVADRKLDALAATPSR